MAIIMPNEPFDGGSAIVARSMSSTETDDRFPLSRSEFLVWSRASAGRSRPCSIASITLRPPGWQTQVEISAVDNPWSARNRLTSSPTYFSVIVATSYDSTIVNPSLPISQPSTFSVLG